jgi:hypothetical protein
MSRSFFMRRRSSYLAKPASSNWSDCWVTILWCR